MKNYVRPSEIDSEMGGNDLVFDDRLKQVFKLLGTISFEGYKTVLDVGTGKGQISKWFAQRGFEVTGTGLFLDSYGINSEELVNYRINLVECSIEKMPFENESFDIIILSHVIEHCPNIGLALQEVKRLLSKNGLLCIFVPPSDDIICAGHISMGWNVGQLLYILLINGFDVSNGKFVEFGYNVASVVKKSHRILPPLRGDKGDIHILSKQNYLPLPIQSNDGLNDNFYGRIRSINWDIASLINENNKNNPFLFKLIFFFVNLFPDQFKHRISASLNSLARLFSLSYKKQIFKSPN
jgi:ubiquinone/menaquinone biosynthesis C-methylase UbiE